MRRLFAFGLSLAFVSTGLAAPQKENLPAGAIARLGAPVVPAKGDLAAGEISALAFLDDHILFVGTAVGLRISENDAGGVHNAVVPARRRP